MIEFTVYHKEEEKKRIFFPDYHIFNPIIMISIKKLYINLICRMFYFIFLIQKIINL